MSKKSKAKLQSAVQSFYDKAIVDQELQKMVDKLKSIPEAGKEYHTLMDQIFDYLDRKCQEEIRSKK